MYQVEEIESLIKIKKPRYLNRFNRISARWQSKLQKYQEDGKFSEYVEYSDKIKNHIARIRKCVNMQRGGMEQRKESARDQQDQESLPDYKKLYFAIRDNDKHIVEAIIGSNSDLLTTKYLTNDSGNVYLDRSKYEDIEIKGSEFEGSQLLDNSVYLDLPNNIFYTAVDVAAKTGYKDIVQFLLDKEEEGAEKNKHINKLLCIASKFNRLEVVAHIIESHKSSRDYFFRYDDTTCLTFAVRNNSEDIVRAILADISTIIRDNQLTNKDINPYYIMIVESFTIAQSGSTVQSLLSEHMHNPAYFEVRPT